MLASAFLSYDKLYFPDSINFAAAQSFLELAPPSACISTSNFALSLKPITFDELVEAFSRHPITNSLGLDGLPYEIVKPIVLHLLYCEIALQVFNNALQYGILPFPWLYTSVCLLPKMGDLSDLKS